MPEGGAVCSRRRKSLLPRFYGAYSITIQNHEKHFVVMESVFRDARQVNGVPGIHQVYDLKGSWIDRHAGIGSGGTLKDMDLHQPLMINRADADALVEELRHDSDLLRSANLMDYSLLLGVHNQQVATSDLDVRRAVPDAPDPGPGFVVSQQVNVPEYYMGMIDVLQAWNLSKRIERWAKIVLKGRWAKDVKDGMSAVEPNAYRDRFLVMLAHQFGLVDT